MINKRILMFAILALQFFLVQSSESSSSQQKTNSEEAGEIHILEQMIKNGDIQGVRKHLTENPDDISFKNSRRQNLLMLAILNDSKEIFQEILSQFCEKSISLEEENNAGNRALDMVMDENIANNLFFAQNLISNGAKVDHRFGRKTPFINSLLIIIKTSDNTIREKFKQIAQYLLSQGADINFVVDMQGMNALLYAINYADFDMVQFLLEKGANVNSISLMLNAKTWEGKTITPLLYAVIRYIYPEKIMLQPNDYLKQLYNIIQLLIEKKAIIGNIERGSGQNPIQSPLSAAAQGGIYELIKLFATSGADMDEEYLGKTPLEWAVALKSDESFIGTRAKYWECTQKEIKFDIERTICFLENLLKATTQESERKIAEKE